MCLWAWNPHVVIGKNWTKDKVRALKWAGLAERFQRSRVALSSLSSQPADLRAFAFLEAR